MKKGSKLFDHILALIELESHFIPYIISHSFQLTCQMESEPTLTTPCMCIILSIYVNKNNGEW